MTVNGEATTPPTDDAYPPSTLQPHKLVSAASGRQMSNGLYDDAVFNAFKAVENRVKRLSGKSEIGKRLMTYVFNEKAPSLDITSPNADDEQKADEREGFKFLFMGAAQGLRNPRGHGGELETPPAEALEMLALASLLMRALDRAEEQLERQPAGPEDNGEWDSDDDSEGDGKDDAPGTLDLIASAESALPGLATTLDAMTVCLTNMGSIATKYGPKIQAAAQKPTMSARLAVVQDVATELGPPAERFRELAADYVGQVGETDPGIDALTHIQPYASMSVDDQAQYLFLAEAIKGLRDASVQGVGSAEDFSRNFSDVAKLSKALKRPSADIRDGVRQMKSAQHYFDEWVEGFEDAGVWDSPTRD